ncbi:MAG: leucine--tRNA ligase [Synergistaceae bacterium]|jgi:leucyl-tRNA synthetase|nr:leucine--tRNA ligase [Synergistaceae bacterium]
MTYDFSAIEPKWRKIWEERKAFHVERDESRPKFYCLEMFPYPSGALHMGHLRNYSIGDLTARFLRMNGYNVMYPIGFDSFGMPAENAAIKMKTHPAKWTMRNIDHMIEQLKSMGCGYDWRRVVKTCLPEYYRWSQWFFLQMYKRGLAYRKHAPVNWCGTCGTVLANEQVIGDGVCWRCETPVVKKGLEQWFLRITDYAQELLDYLDQLSGWPERVLTMQRNWIGRSEGVRFNIAIADADLSIEAFTTRIDTIFGITFVAIAAEHPIVKTLADRMTPEKRDAALDFASRMSARSAIERTAVGGDKMGMDTGFEAVNPVNGARIPIWIADYILMDYGTGAIMGVPAHDQRDFDFVRKYGLGIIPVVRAPGEPIPDPGDMTSAADADGVACNSGRFDGMPTPEAIEKIGEWFERESWGKRETQYRLRDWLISRQRYWGTPIPVVYCDKCGIVPVPEEDLPVELPLDATIPPNGGNALLDCADWINTTCPKCGGHARRETDTMDTFICSSWYFFRYLSPGSNDAPFTPEDSKYWMPVDLYIGGIEHACLHLIYARFFTKVLSDLGITEPTLREPFKGLLTQGMVIKDGAKMSKSLGNVVDPDEIIKRYGADTARLFILFASPPDKSLDWSDKGVEGAHRFLSRVYRLVEDNLPSLASAERLRTPMSEITGGESRDIKRLIHSTIDRVTRDIKDERQLNTAVARLMELCNGLLSFAPPDKTGHALFREGVESLLLCLSPFCPHICEELWEMIGNEGLLARAPWPSVDKDALAVDSVTVVLQINGKLREQFSVPPGLAKDELIGRVMAEDAVKRRLDGFEVVKVIAVPDKLVNIVVKGK